MDAIGAVAAPRISQPVLMIHSDQSALPDNVRKFYNALKGPKDLLWTQGQHLDVYDKDPYVTKATNAIANHFTMTLINPQHY